ncbi:MAG: diaminopimelate epimerase [Armatimonadetes bacterium]|nr:diaminopimelate epimerase [Armatimonadota bacterium]
MDFVKLHGLGNDFLMIDARDKAGVDWAALARSACHRNFGVGGDGLLLLLPSTTCDWRLRIINSDGSEAEMCGNGIRCFAKWLRDRGLETRDTFTVETLAGIITPTIVDYDGGATALVAVDMGEPRLAPDQIPFAADPGTEQVVGALLQVDEEPFLITCVSMGNPHCVLFVDDLDQVSVESWGPQIERHPRFPQKTNVEFVQVHNRQEMTMRVWERGAGRTLACGTGACASLVAAVLTDRADREAVVHLDGGDLRIAWPLADNRIVMTGPATTAFWGSLA